MGAVDNPSYYYERAQVICLTSATEGFPMVLLEAMHHGCVPIVFDSFEAARDIVDDGSCGRVIEAFDVEAYAIALQELLVDDDYRLRLSQNAIRSNQKYNAPAIIDRWENLFKTLNNGNIKA